LYIFLVVGLGLIVYGLGPSLNRSWWSQPAMAAVLTIALLVAGVLPAWAAPTRVHDQAAPPEAAATDGGTNPADRRSSNGGPTDAGDIIPSETVSRFVEAYLAVVELIESKEASLQRAETDTESRQMQAEIQRQALALIQDHDLTLQAYWELLGLANSDPEFRERVLAQVEESS
jgi:hypothetical protein